MIIYEDTQLLPGQFYVSVDEDDMYKTSKEHIVSFKKHTFAPSTTIARQRSSWSKPSSYPP